MTLRSIYYFKEYSDGKFKQVVGIGETYQLKLT